MIQSPVPIITSTMIYSVQVRGLQPKSVTTCHFKMIQQPVAWATLRLKPGVSATPISKCVVQRVYQPPDVHIDCTMDWIETEDKGLKTLKSRIVIYPGNMVSSTLRSTSYYLGSTSMASHQPRYVNTAHCHKHSFPLPFAPATQFIVG